MRPPPGTRRHVQAERVPVRRFAAPEVPPLARRPTIMAEGP
ncbi:hypothetical protein ACFPM0_37305 [Pseudonocardia sulfidoxydans]